MIFSRASPDINAFISSSIFKIELLIVWYSSSVWVISSHLLITNSSNSLLEPNMADTSYYSVIIVEPFLLLHKYIITLVEQVFFYCTLETGKMQQIMCQNIAFFIIYPQFTT